MNDGTTEVPYNEESNSTKVKVGAVSYLNTKPLIFGFEKGMMKDNIELVIDHPANIATALLDGTIDIGLVPVAIIPKMKRHFIVSDYCIAADGEVASVCLFSEVPVEQITRVLLDYQSRTSVMLAKYLFRHHWNLDPELVNAAEGFIQDITGTTAAVVIGDRAFVQRTVSTYHYDLSLAWKKQTGLPFVFAAWVSNKPLSQEFTNNFNEACNFGISNIDEVIAENPYQVYDLHKYYTENIRYKLDDNKMRGLQLFLDWCAKQYEVLPAKYL